MKKVFLTVLTVIICFVGYGQKLKFGLKGGMNSSNTKFTVFVQEVSSERKYDSRISYYIGGFVEYLTNPESNKSISLQAELQYSKQGYSYNRTSEFGFTFQLDQLNLPLTLKKPLVDNFSIVGGIYLGYVTSSNEEFGGGKFQQNEYFNFDTGLIIGTEYSFDFGLFMEIRYMYGLADISDFKSQKSNIEHEYKNRVFQIGLGYTF